MLQALSKITAGNYNKKQIKRYEKEVVQINEFYNSKYKNLSEADVKKAFKAFKAELSENPELVNTKRTEIFAAIKAAAEKLWGHTYEIRGKQETWQMIPYDVQLIGGLTIHEGRIAEMKTGEGKTLVCTLPVILNALCGKGVHVITVNDYLAQRDAEWMQPLYKFCGLRVGVITGELDYDARRAAYNCDITYGTNNEFGFDYLRDNMTQNAEHVVQRDLHFAIVDEVDSILVDEARTPLIISAPANESTDQYHQYADIITHLKENEDYNIDLKQKSVHLSENGVKYLEKLLEVEHLFTSNGFRQVHMIEQALKAHVIMQKDSDYVVRDNKVIIVDEFTGRLMDGRRFSDGLHQSLEAKEGVQIQKESKTLATITFQNYFRLYKKLSGMTGTAETEAEEFAKIYKLDTIVIPTNRPIQREDLSDKIFQNERGKYLALADHVQDLNEKGQPVLIGTVSIEKSEVLSGVLSKQGIKHEVLNAKHHEREAEIVSNAGAKGAVTIATNMAGRGTDIKINDEVKALGGLAILGTERHESRRIDNQLRGRAGRQGDPGFSQFYISMTDELMRRFGGERMAAMMANMQLPEKEAISNPLFSRSVEGAQKKIEGFHFDARKHIVQYDDIMNVHREKIYTKRRKYLSSEDSLQDVEDIIKDYTRFTVEFHCPSPNYTDQWNVTEVHEIFNNVHQEVTDPLTLEELQQFHHRDELVTSLQNYLLANWDVKKSTLPENELNDVVRQILLRSIDEWWLEHIDEMAHLRDRVALSGYAQRDPLMEYKSKAFEMFRELLQNVRETSLLNLFRVKFVPNLVFEENIPENVQTNDDIIEAALNATAELDIDRSGLSRQQKRALKRKEK